MIAIGLGIWLGTAANTPAWAAGVDLINSLGADVVVFAPGIGTVNGLALTNWQDAGVTAAVVDAVLGRLDDAAGGAIPLNQTTAGFKPYLRKGVVNRLTYSETFSNAAWLKINTTFAAPTITVTVTGGRLQRATDTLIQNKPAYVHARVAQGTADIALVVCTNTAVNVQYAKFTLSGSGSVSGTNGAGVSAAIINNGDGTYDISMSLASVTAAAPVIMITPWDGSADSVHPLPQAQAGKTVDIYRAMAAATSMIPVYVTTTTVPLSNSDGQYWIDFDGTDDVMATAALAGWTGATIITGVHEETVTTAAAQDVSAGYSLSTYGNVINIITRTAPSAGDLAILQNFAGLFI